MKAVGGLANMFDSLRSAAQELDVPELIQAVYDRTGTIEAFEAERTIEARGRIENLEAFVDGAREYESSSRRGRPSPASCRRSRSSPTRTRSPTRAT